MFAYCENNPINFCDETGEISFWYIIAKTSLDWGLAHRLVQADIAAHYFGVEIEVSIDRKKELGGRADVYLNGYVWEVKSMGSAYLAYDQAETYVTWPRHKSTEIVKGLGAAGAFEGTIIFPYFGYTFVITYTTPIEGVIVYYVEDCTPNLDEETVPAPKYSNEYASGFVPVVVPVPALGPMPDSLLPSRGNDFFPQIAYAN